MFIDGTALGQRNANKGYDPEPRRPEHSWVVNAAMKEPTGYTAAQKHPDLYRVDDIIKTPERLRALLETCRRNRERGGLAGGPIP